LTDIKLTKYFVNIAKVKVVNAVYNEKPTQTEILGKM